MGTVPTGPGNKIDVSQVKFNAHINLGSETTVNSTITADQIQAAIEAGFAAATPPIAFSAVNVQGPVITPALKQE